MTDSQTRAFAARADAADPEYKRRVAEPTMRAIDAMPREWRRLIHDYGYVDVYRAWKRGWSVEQVRAKAAGGVFVL